MHNVNYRTEQNNASKSHRYGNGSTFEQHWCGTEYARPKPAFGNTTPRAARVGYRSRTGEVIDIIFVLNEISRFA